MRASLPAVFLTALAPFLVDATPVTTNSTTIAPTATANSTSSIAPTATSNATSTIASGPCATVSSLWASQIIATPSATPIVDASLAYECLNSVALNKTAAIELVDASAPYIEWQSDLAYLKDPPADYYYAPFDVFGALATVRSNLVDDVYTNEYEFQKDLYQVFAPAHDGHFVLYPDLLTKAFEWGRQLAIVSISSDGVEVPKIYSYDDVIASPSTAPALVEIDGVDAATYIQDFAETACFNQDIDACYNSMFFEKAFIAGDIGTGYFSINGRVRYIYPGANTTFTFDNGTTVTYDNVAHVKGNFAGVVDGPSFYKKFCSPTHTATPVGAATTSAAAVPTGPSGYPVPVVSSNDTIVSGYFLEETGFEDVAVLSMLAMESESPVEFQAVVQEFLADAVAAGKTKLVVDLSANGGGYIFQGYDTFRQLFPQIVQSDYTRFRENEAFLDAAHIFSDAIPANYSPSTASDETIEFYESFLNWRYDYNLTEQPFVSFEDKFAPHIYAGDSYTNIIRWNLNDPLTTSNSSYGFGTDITGYGSRTNFTQPFLAENIVLLWDGYCASTCIIFSEFMIHDAGVKSIAMGGRPNTDPIQGMGGVKGSQSFAWSAIYDEVQLALPLATSEQAAVLNNLTSLPILRSSSSSVNLRDTILPGNLEDGIPAQFVAEYADCRLFYTAPMISDVTKLWEAAATAAWGGGACVAGSLTEKRDVDAPALKRSPWEMKDAERRRSSMVRPEKREVTEKDALWNARHGKKVIQ